MRQNEHRAQIAELAASAFARHRLAREGEILGGTSSEGRWFCGEPGRSSSHFRVITAPGSVIVLGSLGELILACQERDALAWLRGCVEDLDYILGKARAFSGGPPKVFFAAQARAHLAWMHKEGRRGELAGLIEAEIRDARLRLADGPEGERVWQLCYYHVTGDAEVPACSDWSGSLLWLYHALCTFVRLLGPVAEATEGHSAHG